MLIPKTPRVFHRHRRHFHSHFHFNFHFHFFKVVGILWYHILCFSGWSGRGDGQTDRSTARSYSGAAWAEEEKEDTGMVGISIVRRVGRGRRRRGGVECRTGPSRLDNVDAVRERQGSRHPTRGIEQARRLPERAVGIRSRNAGIGSRARADALSRRIKPISNKLSTS